MSREKKLKIFFITAVAFSIMFLLYTLFNIISPNHGVLVSNSNLSQIKKSLSSSLPDLDFLNLTSIEGNKKLLALTFKDTRYSGEENTYNILYNVKKKKVIKTIEYKDLFVNLIDSCFIKYVNDDTFIVLGNDGVIYSLSTGNERLKLKEVTSIDVNKKNLFKHMYSNKSLYIITRDTRSKYNEKTLSNTKAYQINFRNNSHTKANIIDYKFNDDDFIYSFVLDTKGNIGILGSSSILLPGEEVNKLKLPSDELYLKNLPSENKNYKFIDSSNIWVRFLHDDSLVKISKDNIDMIYMSIHNFINSTFNQEIGLPNNIPIVLGDDYTLYSSHEYSDILYGLPILPSANVFKISSVDSKDTILSTMRSNIQWYNYKNYIGFISTNDGLAGITKKGEIKIISKSSLSFPYKNMIIYAENGSIQYQK